VIRKGIYALPMSDDERAFFRTVAERDPPKKPVKEVVIVAGRRGGKDSVASVIAAHTAAMFSSASSLRPGERGVVMCLACDRDQAKIVLNYTRSYFTEIDLLRGMVQKETQYGFELTNNIDISVATNSFRSVRGRPILCAILDEVAYWRDDNSANPDKEVYDAIKPGLASLPGSVIIMISSPYRKSGLLHTKYRDKFGKDDDRVLVIKAPTRVLNRRGFRRMAGGISR
jgi:phage terminase large subunit-like protein